jgi:hypothetical protein
MGACCVVVLICLTAIVDINQIGSCSTMLMMELKVANGPNNEFFGNEEGTAISIL